jgi:hypothetical protein
VNHFFIGLFTTNPEEVAAVPNDRFMNVWDGTSQNQWSNTPKSRAMPLSTGSCSGGAPRHDVGVLVVAGLATDLAGEG